MTSNSLVPKPKVMKPRTQSRMRIASAETYLTVPTSMACAVEKSCQNNAVELSRSDVDRR